MAIYYSETFESFTSGNIVGQHGWTSLFQSGDTPLITIANDSLLDNVNSVKFLDVGGAPGETVALSPSFGSQMQGTKDGHIRVRTLAPTGAQQNGQLYLITGQGGLINFQLRSYEGSGANAGKTVLDAADQVGLITLPTGLAINTKITVDIYLFKDPTPNNATYALYANGSLLTTGRKFFFNGGDAIDQVFFDAWYSGYTPSISARYDNLLFEDNPPHPFPSFYQQV